jgi:putative transposase
MKYAWIEQHRDCYDIALMCQLLGVSRSGLHAAASRGPSPRAQADAQIVAQLRAQQQRHRGCYGRRRMRHALVAQRGEPINHKRIGRLMRQHGLQSQIRRRHRVVTTDSKHAHPIAPNTLQRDFTAAAPDRKWLADITYVETKEGWLYVALVLDVFSRKFVGWAASDSLVHDLTVAALRMALVRRDPDAGLLHHSDRGVQYAAAGYRDVLAARGIEVSMSRTGDCWDNAAMESANGTVKVECVQGQCFETRAQAQQVLVAYFGYYNTERLHSTLGYQTPAQFEQRWHAEQQRQAAASR